MTISRDLTAVINGLLKIAPDDEFDLRQHLMYVREKIIYTAPEIMRQRWQEVQHTVGRFIPAGDDLNEWQTRFVALWMNKAGE